MRRLSALDQYRRTDDPRIVERYGGNGHDAAGVFEVPCGLWRLHVIATNGDAWDHVSVSLPSRCPTWDEMEFVKRMFFRPTEVAVQLHLPPADHINVHPYVLHLWRPHHAEIPLPPKIMV